MALPGYHLREGSEEAREEENRLALVSRGREKLPNTLNPLWEGGKVKLPHGRRVQPKDAQGSPKQESGTCSTWQLVERGNRKNPSHGQGQEQRNELPLCICLVPPHEAAQGSKQCGRGKAAQPKAQGVRRKALRS